MREWIQLRHWRRLFEGSVSKINYDYAPNYLYYHEAVYLWEQKHAHHPLRQGSRDGEDASPCFPVTYAQKCNGKNDHCSCCVGGGKHVVYR